MASQSFLKVPFKARVCGSPYQVPSISRGAFVPRRRFHASPPRPFLDSCFTVTHTLITSIHSVTGFPWSATLPLTALLLRLTVIGPLTTYGHSITLQRSALSPLMHAWQHVFRRQVMKDHAALGPVACQKIVKERYDRKWREMVKARGVQFWKVSLNWLQLPVFLVVIETVRKMSGVGDGLLGLLMKRFKESEDVSQIGGVRYEAIQDGAIPGEIIPNGAFQNPLESTIISTEPAFATEGILWFPNLLLPDPQLILPFLLSGVLFTNIFFHESVARRASSSPPSNFQKRLRNALKIVALAIGPLTLQVPSAMLVYWISSSLCALGQNVFLEWYMPHPKAVVPCKPRQSGDFAGLNAKK